MTIGDFLLRRLSEAGVGHLFGVPDLPSAIATGSNSGADLEYGPRGPQHRDNAQVRPA
jgi:hypothetical protein